MIQTDLEKQFNESFSHCVNDPRFLDKFYQVFISSSDEVKKKFKDTDMEVQKVMLMTSMAYMTRAYNNDPEDLLQVAIRHNKHNLNIEPYLYSQWLDCLIIAAKSIDPLFDDDSEKLWRKVMQPGIDYMIGMYNQVLR